MGYALETALETALEALDEVTQKLAVARQADPEGYHTTLREEQGYRFRIAVHQAIADGPATEMDHYAAEWREGEL